jgi:uncharacterized protein YjbI with pentapeptide repeats
MATVSQVADWDEPEFAAALEQLRHDGVIDARARQISRDHLKRILDAAPRDQGGRRPLLRDADFREATFHVGASFGLASFERVRFDRAVFEGRASFFGASFERGVRFDKASFERGARFDGATFSGKAVFHEAQFGPHSHFDKAHFRGEADFHRAQFAPQTRPDAHIHFDGAAFCGKADFHDARFGPHTHFDKAHFRGDADFHDARFSGQAWLGPMFLAGTLCFERTAFEEDVRLEVAAGVLLCRGTRFAGRADLNVRWAEIALDDGTFLQRSRLAGVAPFSEVDETPAQLCRVGRRLDADPRPRLVSLRQANVENLALGNLNLRACRFFGAHGLDQLRIEADCDFAQPPRRWRYTRRRTLAEEHHWQAWRRSDHRETGKKSQLDTSRASRDERGWHPPECQPPAWLTPQAEVLDPPRIASLYRALRKALEDRKDEPGAADFYYGEMEMRRHAAKARRRVRGIPGIEEAVLWPYWLVSGYGLRASRALLALAVTIAVGAVLLDLFGFDDHERPEAGTLLFAVESSISLLRAPDTDILTDGGNVVQIVLRLAGPLFFGLALLSLRGRVKR